MNGCNVHEGLAIISGIVGALGIAGIMLTVMCVLNTYCKPFVKHEWIENNDNYPSRRYCTRCGKKQVYWFTEGSPAFWETEWKPDLSDYRFNETGRYTKERQFNEAGYTYPFKIMKTDALPDDLGSCTPMQDNLTIAKERRLPPQPAPSSASDTLVLKPVSEGFVVK